MSMFHWIGPVSHYQLVINVLCVRWSYDRIKTNQAELVRASNMQDSTQEMQGI